MVKAGVNIPAVTSSPTVTSPKKHSWMFQTFNTICWVKVSAEAILQHLSYFFQKIGFDISCKLSPKETICMKCQSLFSGKNKKNIVKLLSVEFVQGVLRLIFGI